MMFRKILFCFLILFCACNTIATAYEPPIIDLMDGLNNGKIAFIARITKIEEKKIEPHEIICEATMQLVQCFYGISCSDNRTIKMQYTSKTIVDRSLPIDFLISSEVLIILNSSTSKLRQNEFTFNSSLDGKPDLAYVIGDIFPDNFQHLDEVRFYNIYDLNIKYRISQKDISKWKKMRDGVKH